MNQYKWPDCPENTKLQIDGLIQEIKDLMVNNIVGIYLHGSLAMGCFNPNKSDIDIIVITKTDMDVETKREIIKALLKLSKSPSPIEISFIKKYDIEHWQYPTPFELHYSEKWRSQNVKHLESGEWKAWNDAKHRHKDPDLAAHFTIIINRGIVLYGENISCVFKEIPKRDYIESIMNDFNDIDDIRENPVYYILNACRIYAYLKENKIFSKDEGGTWALTNLSSEYLPLIRKSLEYYRNNYSKEDFDLPMLQHFSQYMKEKVYTLYNKSRTVK